MFSGLYGIEHITYPRTHGEKTMIQRLITLIITLAIIYGCAEKGKEDTVTFSYSITQDAKTGWHIVQLNAEHSGDPGKNISIRVAPEAGSNLFSFVAGGTELMDATDDLENLPIGGRGCFIMYPSPNRVRDGVYEFMGERHSMLMPGEEKHNKLHGLVRDDTAWEFDEPVVDNDRVSFRTRYVFDPDNPRYGAFPYDNILTVEFSVMSDKVRVRYEVENTGDRKLGFGFGLHPFWKAIGGRDMCRILVDIPNSMEATSDLLPTGNIMPVAGTPRDLMKPTRVSDTRLDDVYIGATPETAIEVFFDSIGIKLRQRATSDFTHVVVYTPDREYFCVENQTCSTDAHNMYAKGMVEESHLQVVDPGQKTDGYIDFIVEQMR